MADRPPNKVGTNNPTPETITSLTNHCHALKEGVAPFTIALGTEEKKELKYPRYGAEPMMEKVAQLSTEYKVEVPGVPLAEMHNDLALARTIKPLADEVSVVFNRLQDTRTQAISESWDAFLAYYGVLTSMAKHNPDLARALEEVTEFMARRKKSEPKKD